MSKLTRCYNRGCGEVFDANDNNDEQCQYHPGEPYFHDAYKSWTCCTKKTTNFTEFLDIKGCTRGVHNPDEPVIVFRDSSSSDESEPEGRYMLHHLAPREMRVYQTPMRPSPHAKMTKLPVIVSPILVHELKALKKYLNNLPPEPEIKDPLKILDGTACLNNGCTTTYEEGKELDQCVYHKGSAVFHEGMKFWSCCRKICSDFSKFLVQPGCVVGDHIWVKPKETKMNCRYDWHQTPEYISIAIYAKKYDPEMSFVKSNEVRVTIHLYFPENEIFYDNTTDLFEAIDEHKSSVSMTPTKVEIKLKKCNRNYWSTLEHKC